MGRCFLNIFRDILVDKCLIFSCQKKIKCPATAFSFCAKNSFLNPKKGIFFFPTSESESRIVTDFKWVCCMSNSLKFADEKGVWNGLSVEYPHLPITSTPTPVDKTTRCVVNRVSNSCPYHIITFSSCNWRPAHIVTSTEKEYKFLFFNIFTDFLANMYVKAVL